MRGCLFLKTLGELFNNYIDFKNIEFLKSHGIIREDFFDKN